MILFKSMKLPLLSAARSQALSTERRLHVENVLIIGSGLMGSGIAQASATASAANFKSIVLQDVDSSALDKAKSRMHANLAKMASKNNSINPDEIIGKITFSTAPEPKSADNLLVIEAVTENLKLKQDLFKALNFQFKSNPCVILVTNTSSLSCKAIAKDVKAMDRFGGLHFFNPVPLMKLVEVIRVPETSNETFDALMNYTKAIGKVPVACKDTPGFIVNRLLVPYMFEAIQMLERGDASARDIDTAMKLGAGYPMGPFELLDYVGLDTSKHICDAWSKLPNPIIRKSALLEKMVSEGKLGKKSGQGFYDYSGSK